MGAKIISKLAAVRMLKYELIILFSLLSGFLRGNGARSSRCYAIVEEDRNGLCIRPGNGSQEILRGHGSVTDSLFLSVL
jgi:hypothetical protein